MSHSAVTLKVLSNTFCFLEKHLLEWDLLGSLMELTKVQSDSLSALKPTISYIVNNNRGFDYQVNERGLLQSISPCQCLPRTENTSLALSGIQFSCPAGTADTLSGEKNGIMTCLDDGCPTTLTDDLCDTRSLWSEWTPCTKCLVQSSRSRFFANGEKEIETKGVEPLILTASSRMNLTLLEGSRLSVFAVGGGGAADSTYAGSSGFFKHQTLFINQTQSVVLDITIGNGGGSSGANGQTTTVRGLPSVVSAQGGGGAKRPGWSGVGGGNDDVGGFNGKYGTNEPLPILCHVKLTPGSAGSSSSDGTGAGGIVVDGQKPTKRSTVDGEGYGAGGGEDDRSGYPGVVVLTLCDS